jgi:hypothetical protein
MSNNISLLQNANNIKLELAPFPHIIIKNALDENVYNDLSKKFPLEFFAKNNKKNMNNIRKDLFFDELNAMQDVHDDWKKFIEYHSSISFFHEILHIFEKIILSNYYKKFDSKEKLYNCNSVNRFSTSINTPVLEASSVRSAHLDNLNKLFTGLFYMKQDDDKSTGGDLELYSWNKNISNVKKRKLANNEIDIDYIKYEKTISYGSNTFLIFLNSLDALHGVTPRSLTKNYRRMCVFTSKLPFSLDQPTLIERLKLKSMSFFNN